MIFFFFIASTKGSGTDSFQIKPKNIPDWEKSEIEEEKKHKEKSKITSNK